MTKRRVDDSFFDFSGVLGELFSFKTEKCVDNTSSTAPETSSAGRNYRTREMSTELDLIIELPGVVPADVSLQVQLNKVIVKGKKDGKSFTNTYTISNVYVTDAAQAWLSNGELTVRLQKSPMVDAKDISIRVL